MRQVLSDRSCRRWSRRTGLEIVRMLARGSSNHWHSFVTADHRHGYLHVPDGRVEWQQEPVTHYTSCRERFAQGGS